MPQIDVPKHGMFRTSRNIFGFAPSDVSEAENMVWADDYLVGREGSSLFKNSTQWSGQKVISGKDFAVTGETFYRIVVALDDGRLFYVRSDNVSFGTASVTWTEILSTGGSSPALSAATTSRSLHGFNNKLFVADGTNNLYYINFSTDRLVSVTLPGSLTGNVVGLNDKSSSMWVLSDEGRTYKSAINDGTDLTGIGTGSLNYGRTEGLVATNMISFGDELLITTENKPLSRYQTYRLLGIQFYDPLAAGSDRDQFEVKKVRSFSGMIGATTEEIAADTIGLTPRGFASARQAISSVELKDTDYISYPIKELVEQIDFSRPDLMSATVDYIAGRYYCAVPLAPAGDGADIILVYDFLRSRPVEGLHRWTVWSFKYESIETLFSVAGRPFMSTVDGNVYKLDDVDANFADDSLAINKLLQIPLVGGTQKGIEKSFDEMNLGITDIANFRTTPLDKKPFEITFLPYTAGKGTQTAFADDDKLPAIKIEQPDVGILYDEAAYYDIDFYDGGGSDSRVVSETFAGDRAVATGWTLNTDEVGINWGLAGYSVNIKGEGLLDSVGANNIG